MPRTTRRDTEIASLKALIDLLKAEGVRSFEGNGFKLEFFAAAVPTETARDLENRPFVVPDKLSKVDRNYFHPSLGVVEFK